MTSPDQDHHLPALKDIIKIHKLSAEKALGQNFLLDMNILRKIARAAQANSNIPFLEVGPGPGGLTRALLAEGAPKVIVIEKDKRCLPILEEIQSVYSERLEIIQGDALKINLDDLFDTPYRIATNLPYNISSDFITSLITQKHYPKKWLSATMMLQKEFAVRMKASVGSKDYSRLSVLSSLTCDVSIEFDVNPANFTPPPRVISAITKIIPYQAEPECDLDLLAEVTRATFGQRRKMIKSSLKSICPNPELLCENANIDSALRADHLSPKDYIALTQEFLNLRSTF